MQSMAAGYSDAISASDRTVDIYLSIGTGIDTTAADDLVSITGDFLPMSNTDQITDAVYYMTRGLTTYEGYGIPTAVSNGNIAPPLEATAYPPEAGAWSSAISDANGSIDFTIILTLSQPHTSALRIYTDGPAVLEAEAVFVDGETRASKAFVCHAGYIEVADVMTYTSIEVTVSKLDSPYRHVRIVECEFGASIALSKSELGGEVTVIRETDPVELTAPMWELDLSVLNVSGDFDPDNPAGRFGELAIGYPLELSYTVRSGEGQRYTVRCGRYYIGERTASDTRLDLTAFDARWMLSTVYASWTMPSGQSIGKTLDDLLTDYAIPHLIETDLFEVMPDGAYGFDDKTSIADDLLTIQQAYAIYCIPDRGGTIRVTQTWPADTYGSVPTDTIYSWPRSQQMTRYNVVQIGYIVQEGSTDKTYYVTTDLRTDASEGKNVLQISGNKLITTEARATAVMQRLVGRIAAQEVETEWRGDPAMDLGDSVQIPGKWTQDAPLTYEAVYIEETYDGSYRAVMRGTS